LKLCVFAIRINKENFTLLISTLQIVKEQPMVKYQRKQLSSHRAS
jgi:hypothetical protein